MSASNVTAQQTAHLSESATRINNLVAMAEDAARDAVQLAVRASETKASKHVTMQEAEDAGNE